ncbi:unnamed protein product, partial [Effrenium voratum]
GLQVPPAPRCHCRPWRGAVWWRPFPCKMRPKWPGLPGTRTCLEKPSGGATSPVHILAQTARTRCQPMLLALAPLWVLQATWPACVGQRCQTRRRVSRCAPAPKPCDARRMRKLCRCPSAACGACATTR